MTEIWTITEVAEKYRFSERWVRDFCRARNIPVLRSKSKIRFDEIAINAFEDALRVPSRPPKLTLLKVPPVKSREDPGDFSAYDEAVARIKARKEEVARRREARRRLQQGRL